MEPPLLGKALGVKEYGAISTRRTADASGVNWGLFV